MKNKESSKISLAFLGFSTIYDRFPKLASKRKRKLMNSLGPKSAQVGPTTAEMRPRPRAGCFAQRASGFWLIGNECRYCVSESLTICTEVLEVLFLYIDCSPTANRARAMLRRAELGGARKDWCSPTTDSRFRPNPRFPLS
jgi:hypothetical protein